MFADAIVANLIAAGIAESVSISGKKVYRDIRDSILPEHSDIITSKFSEEVSDSLNISLTESQLEQILEPTNQLSVESVYQDRSEISKQIAVQISAESSLDTQPNIVELESSVRAALDRAVSNWFSEVAGTPTADRLLLQMNWENESQLEEIEEKLDTVLEKQSSQKWYDIIEVSDSETAIEKTANHLKFGDPEAIDVFIDRPAVPSQLDSDRYLITGRRGMGKTRLLNELQSQFLRNKSIEQIILPDDGFLGPEDAQCFSEETLSGDTLLIWDDIQELRSKDQSTTIRESILRLSNALEKTDSTLYVIATVQSEYRNSIENIDRTKDRLWDDFDLIELQPLSKEMVAELTQQAVSSKIRMLSDKQQAQLIEKIWLADPSPLYVESAITSLDPTADQDLTEQIRELPADTEDIWEQQYNKLMREHPNTRFILWSINLLRMGGIPLYETTLRQMYTGVFGRDEFNFRKPLEVLKQKQWIWETDIPGYEVDQTIYDTRDAQMSAVDEDEMRVIDRFAEFLLEHLHETIPNGVQNWVAQYHSNISMFFEKNIIGDTRELAEPQLERAIELDPYNPVVRNNYTAVLEREGRLKEAVIHYESALTVSPNWLNLRNNYAVALEKLGRPFDAIEQYKKIINDDRPFQGARFNLATLYIDLGEYMKAIEQYRNALDCGYHDPDIYNNLAALHSKSGDYLKALKIEEKGVETFPEHRNLNLNLAGTYISLKYPEQARDLLLDYMNNAEETSDAQVHAHLAVAYSELGNRKMTEKHASKADRAEQGTNTLSEDFLETVNIRDVTCENWFDEGPELLRVIDTLLQEEKYTKAWDKSHELLEEGYESAEIYLRLGDLAEKLGFTDKAHKYYKKSISLAEMYVRPYNNYANFCKHQGELEEARKWFKKGIELSNDEMILCDYGLLLLQMDEYEAAAEKFRIALEEYDKRGETNIEYAKIHQNYAQLLFIREQYCQARDHFEQALDINRDYAKARLGLGRLEQAQGNLDVASRHLKEATYEFAEAGMFDEWMFSLRNAITALEENGNVDSAINLCEYGVRIAEDQGIRGVSLISDLQSRKSNLVNQKN